VKGGGGLEALDYVLVGVGIHWWFLSVMGWFYASGWVFS